VSQHLSKLHEMQREQIVLSDQDGASQRVPSDRLVLSQRAQQSEQEGVHANLQ
jgi:hypothetical protein